MITGKLNVFGKACAGREAIVSEKRPSLCWSYVNAAWRPRLHPAQPRACEREPRGFLEGNCYGHCKCGKCDPGWSGGVPSYYNIGDSVVHTAVALEAWRMQE